MTTPYGIALGITGLFVIAGVIDGDSSPVALVAGIGLLILGIWLLFHEEDMD